MYRDEQYLQNMIDRLDSLKGKWEEDNCPFEFDYEKFEKKVKVSDSTENKIKSVDCDQDALIQKQDQLTIITIYSNHEQIKQIEVQRMKGDWNYNKMSFNSEYLCLISIYPNKLYYHNFNCNQSRYYNFFKEEILSFSFQQNELNVVVSKHDEYLSLYRIDFQLELQLLKKIIFRSVPRKQQINAQHRLGFFYKIFQGSCFLISIQTLKPICVYKWANKLLNLKDLGAITQQQDYFIFLDQYFRTLMTQESNGRQIRKILPISPYFQYEKQSFKHFLIICSQQSKQINVCDIYDSIKGRYVATIYYEAKKGSCPVEIKNNQLIIHDGYGYKIKEIYQK